MLSHLIETSKVMNINRRKFIKTGSITTISLSILPLVGRTAIFSENDQNIFELKDIANSPLSRILQGFMSPPDSAKSSTYWWWFNGLINKEGITRDLEEFRKQGIGNVLMINTKDGLQGVSVPLGEKLLSPEWRELYKHAICEAARLNIEVGVNLSSGWCMGGPWITPEYAGRWFLQSELSVTGPRKFSEKLPLPGNRAGYDNVFNPPGFKEYIDLPLEKLDYRDTIVVAIPDNDGDASRFSDERGGEILSAKTNRKDASSHAKAIDVLAPTLVPWNKLTEDKPIPVNRVIDLTSKMSADGTLDWDVPPGKWIIIRTGHRMTGSKLLIAQPEADGFSVDWFAPEGVDLQFENMGKILLEDAVGIKGNTLKYFHDDSFEDGFPNWTDKILTRFEEYRGYDPKPYIPVFSGIIIGNAEISDRFLHDYRKTVADCMADKHYEHFADVCHKNGLLVQNEAAGPSRSGSICMDGLKNLGKSDYPMGEFWIGKRHDEEGGLSNDLPYGETRLENGQNKVTKMVASAAHIYGKETVSAEAFTSHRHWKDSPDMLKQSLDRAFCEGVNRIFIHTSTATRPEDGKPGYEYGAGTHFNPNITWWEKSNAFLSYVARCQYLLRQGKFVADVLYYNGDWAPNIVEPKHIDPALGKGYDYDVCNEEVLLTRLSVKDKRIVLPDGMSYRVLVLPNTTRMPVPVAKKIKELVKAGATVIGPKPNTDPGLKNYPKCDQDIKNIATEVWGNNDGEKIKLHQYGNGRVFTEEPVRDILQKNGIKPDFEYSGENVWIDFIHRTTSDSEIYFLANRKKETAKTECLFRIKDHTPEIWDAVSGIVTKPECKIVDDRISISLDFAEFQSLFIVFSKSHSNPIQKDKAWVYQETSGFSDLLKIDGSWQVRFDPKWGGPEEITMNELQDWSIYHDNRIKYYSGKAYYLKNFNLDEKFSSGKSLFLDLGVVKNIAQIWLNGKDLGIVWTSPWRIDISNVVKSKDNILKIEVINLWPNRLIGDAALPKEKRLTSTNIAFSPDEKLLPSGLLGPVKITEGK